MNEDKKSKKKWYQNPGGAILFLILFFPVGIYLMWRYTEWPGKVKWIVTTVFVLPIMLLLISTPSENLNMTEEKKEDIEKKQIITEEQQDENSNQESFEEESKVEISFVKNNSDIPIPNMIELKEHKPFKAETATTAQQDETFTYIVSMPVEEVHQFYENNMSKYGWELDMNFSDYKTMFFLKNKKEIMIGVDEKSENQSTITIML